MFFLYLSVRLSFCKGSINVEFVATPAAASELMMPHRWSLFFFLLFSLEEQTHDIYFNLTVPNLPHISGGFVLFCFLITDEQLNRIFFFFFYLSGSQMSFFCNTSKHTVYIQRCDKVATKVPPLNPPPPHKS